MPTKWHHVLFKMCIKIEQIMWNRMNYYYNKKNAKQHVHFQFEKTFGQSHKYHCVAWLPNNSQNVWEMKRPVAELLSSFQTFLRIKSNIFLHLWLQSTDWCSNATCLHTPTKALVALQALLYKHHSLTCSLFRVFQPPPDNRGLKRCTANECHQDH